MGGEGSPQLPWRQSQAPQGKGQGQILLSLATFYPPKCVCVPLTPKWATAAS